ncbi:MAG: TPM domain-containing protein [Tepidisphaeraceae bacterium]
MKPFHLIFASILFLAGVARAAEVIPPSPTSYFNDYANVVSSTTAQQLNEKLEQFERDTSNQIVVAIFPKMQSDSSIEDYTVRVAEAWKAGQRLKKNGAVLFVFIQDREVYLQVGYGLEGALPDALAKQIIDSEITPRFKQGDYDGGLTAGVDAIIAATKGEYKGTSSTAHDSNNSNPAGVLFIVIIVLIVLAAIIQRIASAHAYAVYSNRGYNTGIGWYWLLYALMSNRSGSSSRGGGFSGGGGGFSGGGFSGGGGSFGGGGAGGSW